MAQLSRHVAVVDQAVSSISNFVGVAIAANVATPGEFGQFSLSYAGLLLFLGAQRALIGETLLVKYSAVGTLQSSVRGGVLGASTLVSGVTLPFLLAGAVIADQSSSLIWLVMAVSLPFVLLQDTLRYLFICEGRPWRALIIDAVWAALSIASMVAVASTPGAAVWAVALCWGGGAAAALALGLALGRTVPSLRGGRLWLATNRNPGVRYLGEFSALNASNFVVLYLLALPLGPAGVGALRAAQLLFSPLNTAFSAIKMAVIPELVRAKGTAVFRKRLVETIAVVAALAGLWGAAVMLLPASMGSFVLGASWESASSLRLPYLVQYLAMVPYTVLLAYFRSVQANRLSTLMRAALAVLTLVLPLAMAYGGGTAASAWAFTLAVAIAAAAGATATGLTRSRTEPPLERSESTDAELRPAADAM